MIIRGGENIYPREIDCPIAPGSQRRDIGVFDGRGRSEIIRCVATNGLLSRNLSGFAANDSPTSVPKDDRIR
jgi:hypothetical protein